MAALPKTFELDAQYLIRVARACGWGIVRFTPARPYVVKGKVAEAIRADLMSAVKVG